MCVGFLFFWVNFFFYNRHSEDFFYWHHPSKFLLRPNNFSLDLLRNPQICARFARKPSNFLARVTYETPKFSCSLPSKPSKFLTSFAQLSNLHAHFARETLKISRSLCSRNPENFSLEVAAKPWNFSLASLVKPWKFLARFLRESFNFSCFEDNLKHKFRIKGEAWRIRSLRVVCVQEKICVVMCWIMDHQIFWRWTRDRPRSCFSDLDQGLITY